MSFSLSQVANAQFNITEVSIQAQTIIEEILTPIGEDYAQMPTSEGLANDGDQLNPHHLITTQFDSDVGIDAKKWTFKAGNPVYVEPKYFVQVYTLLEQAGKL